MVFRLQEKTQPTPRPRSHACWVFFCLPLTVTLSQTICFSPCLLLPSWASHLRPSPTSVLVLSQSPCCTWPQLFTCIQPCNPHSGPMRAGAGVRVSSQWRPLKCGDVVSSGDPRLLPPRASSCPVVPFSSTGPATLAQSVNVPSWFSASGFSLAAFLLEMLLFSPPVFLSQPTCPHSHFTSNVISWRGSL